MKGKPKTKKQLTAELNLLKKRVIELEAREAGYKRLEQDARLPQLILDRIVQILESSVDLMFIHDIKGNFVYVNEAAARSYGYTKEELLKMKLHALTVPESAELFNRHMNKVLEKGDAVSEIKHYCRDGSIINLEINTSTFEFEGNKVLFSAARDITERKRIEEELAKSETRYRSLVETAGAAVASADVQGNLSFVNETLCKMLGYSQDELIGKPFIAFVHPDDVLRIADMFMEGLAHPESEFHVEMRVVHKDGHSIWIYSSPTPVFYGSELVGGNAIIYDITERKQLERALQESERHYRTLVENAIEGIVVTQGEEIKYANPLVTIASGYSIEELQFMSLTDLVHPDDQKAIAESFSKPAVPGNFHITPPFRLLTKGGETRWIVATVVSIIWDDRAANLNLLRDITESKQAEGALQESESRYRYLFEYSQVANALVGMDGKIIDVNQAAAEIYGYDRSEIVGRNLLEFFVEGSADKAAEAFAAGLKGDSNVPAEFEVMTKNGPRTFYFPGGYHVVLEGGKEAGFLISAIDITERNTMLEALRRSEERYRTMLDEMEEAYYEVDLTGNFTFFSDALCRQLGYSREEIAGMSYKSYIPSENAKEVFEVYNTIYNTGEPRKLFASSQIKKDGTLAYTEDSIFPMRDKEGNIVGFRGISRDITERKRAEEERKQLEQKAQFSSHLASVGELASGVAHEINNPLTAVIGYAHLLLSRKDIPQDIRRDIEVINEGSQRVAGIIKKLLVFARQARPERTYVNINEIINTTLELRAYSLRNNNVTVILQLDPDLPTTVADPGQLQQVFLNLIINAEAEVKSIHVGRLAIKTECAGDSIRISFKDNGLGIAEENLERIFNPFFTTRKVGQGTGLGLSVCHGIITEHKGRIWAESQFGKGATFVVEIPIVKDSHKLDVAEAVVRETRKVDKARILVIDDETVIRKYVSQILAEEGHEVEATDSAEDALQKVNNNDYRAIILDIKMPGMSGIELYKHFQEISPGLADKVVFMTGDMMGPSTMAFLSSSKAPYIVKPFDATQLKAELNRVLVGG
jgi:PAS domain S-box-containing protein